jgi:membrane protease YdiL (CAAX protease family)
MSSGPGASETLTGGFAEYWRESSRPLTSLIFVAPMLFAYEGGLLVLGPQVMRNGADVWLRTMLEGVGFTQYLLLPMLTCGILLAWHHVNGERWQIGWTAVSGMALESTVLGIALLLVAQGQQTLFNEERWHRPLFAIESPQQGLGAAFAFLGAGIYEELLFRLILLPAIYGLARCAGGSRGLSLAASVAAASLLFAAAHYQIELDIAGVCWALNAGEPFVWTSFLFRILAGAVFSLLFLYRGFGVAAGTHALYDIMVAVG